MSYHICQLPKVVNVEDHVLYKRRTQRSSTVYKGHSKVIYSIVEEIREHLLYYRGTQRLSTPQQRNSKEIYCLVEVIYHIGQLPYSRETQTSQTVNQSRSRVTNFPVEETKRSLQQSRGETLIFKYCKVDDLNCYLLPSGQAQRSYFVQQASKVVQSSSDIETSSKRSTSDEMGSQ